jgi:regulatory protein
MAGRRGGSRNLGGPSASGSDHGDAIEQSAEQGRGRADTVRRASEPTNAQREGQTPHRVGRVDADRRTAKASAGRGTAQAGADADPEAIARQICLRLLSAAPRTRAELAAALQRRGVPEDAAAAVLARFTEVKLIDDELFARSWVESRHHGRGLAGRALGAELRQRGVASPEIEAALGQLSPEQELVTARELVERRMSATAELPPLARMRRLTGVLARKGYSPRLAYRVVREALEQEASSGSVPWYEDEVFPEPDEEEAPAEA